MVTTKNKMKAVGGPESSIVFLHIPKAAGSTLHHIFDKAYRKDEVFTIDGMEPFESMDRFKKLPVENRSKIRLLKGHLPFGLHSFLPSFHSYITLLRDPVERVVSYYYYVLRNKDHYLHDRVKGTGMTMGDFVHSRITTEINDFQVRMISGALNDYGFGKCPDELLPLALDNLDKYFSVVGLVEYFDETLLLMRETLDWKFLPIYKKKNVTRGRKASKDLDSDIVDHIKELNQLDCKLYDHVASNFQNELNSIKFFSSKLLLFRTLNRLYGMTSI